MISAHRFSYRVEGAPSPSHVTLRIFANGASAGLLTLRVDDGEAVEFKRRLDAAPDMLAALTRVERVLAGEFRLDPGAREALTAVRSAVAKAEGRA